MLSILIPIFNFDCNKLVTELINQCQILEIPFEIICIDDFSTPEYKIKNKNLATLLNTNYSGLPTNIGRSKIRNLLAQKAKYNNLLFLDCDSEIENNNFIFNYTIYFNKQQVVYGGRCYKTEKPKIDAEILRWKYGVKRETIALETRKKNPYLYFLTNNFLCEKNIFNSVSFNESLIGYGHEDTLYAYELKQKNIPIIHIENPLTHIGLENTEVFLNKTKQGIVNLFKIVNEYNFNKNSVKLYRNFTRLKAIKLNVFYIWFYTLFFNKLIIKNLYSKKPSLFLFDLFKLYWCCKTYKNQSNGE